MYNRTTDEGGRPSSPYRATDTHTVQHGDIRVCELCNTETRCFERFDMVACRSCQDTYLPSRGILL